jgi:hypothetical protein
VNPAWRSAAATAAATSAMVDRLESVTTVCRIGAVAAAVRSCGVADRRRQQPV